MACMGRVYHYLKDNRPTSPTELRERLGFRDRTIGKVLKRLLEVGEIEKMVDSKDRRRRLYFKTRRNER